MNLKSISSRPEKKFHNPGEEVMESREKNVGKDLLIVNVTGCQRQKAVYLDLADGFHFFLNFQESLAFYTLADHVQFVIQG